ncbi:MAG: fatty acid desaturase [Planctomycetes bacterium]|nr:fatty acid desaturase [Planctomycetota bacterium]
MSDSHTTRQLDAHGQALGLTLKPLLQAIPRDCFAISPWRAWATLARQLSVIALLVFALDRLPLHADGRLALELPALATLWVLLGWSFTGLFILGHDCGHYAFSKRRWVNDLLGDLIMATLFSSYKAWKLVHNQHHVWSNVRGKDVGWPEQMKTRRELAQASGAQRFLNWFVYGSPWGLLLGPWLVRPRFWLIERGSVPQLGRLTQRDRRALRFSLALMVLCTGSVVGGLLAYGGLWALVKFYAAPAFVAAAVGGLLILLQHSSEDALVFDPEDHTPFRSQVVGTYDTRYPRLLEWLVLDVNLHLVHHLTPRVPWYALRRATAALKEAYPECVQERRFSFSLLRELWARPALERRSEGYLVRVEAPAPVAAPTHEPRRPQRLPAGLLGSRA